MLPLGTKTSKPKKLTVRLIRYTISLSCGDKRKKLTRYYGERERALLVPGPVHFNSGGVETGFKAYTVSCRTAS